MIHGDLLGERARLSGERTAVVEWATGRRLTYGELDLRAAACAEAWTARLGLGPGDRIAILAGNRLEFLDAFFAAGKSGVVLVTLNTHLAVPELEYILADCGVRALIYDGAFTASVNALRKRVEIDRWIALDDEAATDDTGYGELVDGLPSGGFERFEAGPDDPFCLLYTSGTTGRPKGVVVPHRMVAWNGLNTTVCWQLSENDVSPIFTPLYHAGGLGAFLVPVMAAGGTLVLQNQFDAAEVWRAIEKERCTVVLGVPTIWKMLADAPEFETADLSGVRWFISGGAPLPQYLIETYRRRGVVLRQGYGLTEVGVNCFTMGDEEAWAKAGSIGRPMMFTEARIAGPDGSELPTGEVGELWFRGPHTCLGYWGNPEATAEALDADGWFHTGDMARCDEDGFFFIAGRAKDMFISGGVNIYPAEIEAQLLLHPGVADAAVVGVEHETWGEVGVAFFVAVAGEDPTSQDLAHFLEQRLARFKVPRRFVRLTDLPRTAYGKVVKPELRKMWNEKLGPENGPGHGG